MHNLKSLKHHPSKCRFVIGANFIRIFLYARRDEYNKTIATLVCCITA